MSFKVPWKEYQESAATFFRSLGFEADVEKEISGARGKHKLDVYVTPIVRGIPLKWVIECKCWKSNVTKEKVLALISIVNDIGADRGFLLSEKGFQSGAIQSSKNSNVILSSLSDLELVAKTALAEEDIGKIFYRQKMVHDRLWLLHKKSGYDISSFFVWMLELDSIDFAIDEALKGNYPVSYSDEEKYSKAANWPDLIVKVNKLITDVENFALQYENEVCS